MIIFIKNLNLPNNRNFIFEFIIHAKLIMYVHLIDQNTTSILTQNEFSLSVFIFKRMKFGGFCEIPFDNCFQASLNLEMTKIIPFEMTRPRIKIDTGSKNFHFLIKTNHRLMHYLKNTFKKWHQNVWYARLKEGDLILVGNHY